MSLPAFAGFVLRHGSHFLFIERNAKAKYWPNYWGFPGGKVEDGESIQHAAQREVWEEIGIEVDMADVIGEICIRATYSDWVRTNYLFLIDIWKGMPENIEHDIHSNMEWFTLDDLPDPMIPHVREGFLALLEGRNSLEYDGII